MGISHSILCNIIVYWKITFATLWVSGNDVTSIINKLYINHPLGLRFAPKKGHLARSNLCAPRGYELNT